MNEAIKRYKVLKQLDNHRYIVDYDPSLKEDFVELNKIWIKEMFYLEQADLDLFEAVDKDINEGKTKIFYNLDENGNVLTTLQLAKIDDQGTYELNKFAANKALHQKNAGNELLDFVDEYAKENGIKKFIIISNTKCEAAIHLYQKHGFLTKEIPEEYAYFERGNIFLEKDF